MDKIQKQTWLGYTHGMASVVENVWESGKVNYFVSRPYNVGNDGAEKYFSNEDQEYCPEIIITAEQARTQFQALDNPTGRITNKEKYLENMQKDAFRDLHFKIRKLKVSK